MTQFRRQWVAGCWWGFRRRSDIFGQVVRAANAHLYGTCNYLELPRLIDARF